MLICTASRLSSTIRKVLTRSYNFIFSIWNLSRYSIIEIRLRFFFLSQKIFISALRYFVFHRRTVTFPHLHPSIMPYCAGVIASWKKMSLGVSSAFPRKELKISPTRRDARAILSSGKLRFSPLRTRQMRLHDFSSWDKIRAGIQSFQKRVGQSRDAALRLFSMRTILASFNFSFKFL